MSCLLLKKRKYHNCGMVLLKKKGRMQWSKYLIDPIANESVTEGWCDKLMLKVENSRKTFNTNGSVWAPLLEM